jgi:hypothetical protein
MRSQRFEGSVGEGGNREGALASLSKSEDSAYFGRILVPGENRFSLRGCPLCRVGKKYSCKYFQFRSFSGCWDLQLSRGCCFLSSAPAESPIWCLHLATSFHALLRPATLSLALGAVIMTH